MMGKRLAAAMLTLLLFVALLPAGTFAVTAAGTADLQVEKIGWNTETEVKPGTAVTFEVVVKNVGTAATGAPIKVTFGTGTQQLRTVTHSSSIAAGATVTIKAEPWIAVKGDYMVAVRVNGDQAVAETSYKNNTKQANLRVADAKLTSAYDSTAKVLKDGGLDTLVFSDDFDSISTVDVNNTAKEGYKWYVDRPYGASTLTMDDYSVKNGVMTVHNIVPTYNYGLGTVDCGSHVGFTFNTGYLEVRLRIPRPRENAEGEKGVPAIWALPPEKLYGSDDHWVELDWLEYWGDAYYTVCVHEQYSKNGTVYQHNKNSNVTGYGLNDGEWHVMGWLWQKGLLITYYDGEEVMRLTYKEGEFSSPMQTTVKGELQEGVFVHMDEQQMPIFIGGSKDNPMELDYVRVWDGNDSYVPPKPTVKQMDMSEFWSTYLADENMEPIMEVNAYNYEQILAGEKDYYRMELSQKNQLALFVMNIDQPGYLELLAKAQEVKKNPNAYTTAVPKKTTVAKPVATTTVKKPIATKKPTTTANVAKPTVPDAVVTTPSSEPSAEESTTTATATVTTPTAIEATTGATISKPLATQSADTEPQDTDDGIPGWLIGVIVGAVVLLGGIIVLLVWLTKKKTATTPEE